MPQKRGNKKDDKLQEIFRAVVICDDFDDSLCPITLESPKCLLPIANRPTLAYVLDHLVFRCKFQEILLVSNKYGDVIKQFVQSNYKVSNICKIEYLTSSEFESVGDIFRCFDRDNMVSKEQPFVLLSGSVITNINIRRIFDEFLKITSLNPNAVLHMALSKCSMSDNQSYFLAHDDASKILSFKSPGSKNQPIDVEKGIFKAKVRKRVQLRLDLRSAGIFICSPKTPSIFADPANLDLQSMNDFVKQTIDDEHMGIGTSEVFFSKIKEDEFGDVVTSLERMNSINQAVFDRVISPFTPAYQFRAKQVSSYQTRKKENYRGERVRLSPTAIIEKRCVLGNGVEVGAGSFVTNSSIGDNCKIGENIRIENCVIESGAKIEAGCTIEDSYLGRNVSVYSGSKIAARSVIGHNVALKIICEKPVVLSHGDEDDEDDFADLIAMPIEDVKIEGTIEGKQLLIWARDDDIDKSDDLAEIDLEATACRFWGGITPEEEDDYDGTNSLASESEEESDEESFDEEKQRQKNLVLFNNEVRESVTRCVREKLSSADVVPEITGSRNSYAVEVPQIVRAIGLAIYGLSEEEDKFNVQKFQIHVKHLKDMLGNFLCPNENPNVKMQMEFLQFVNEEFDTTKLLTQKVLMVLYNIDLLDERVILHWNNEFEIKEDLKENIAKFIDYLEEDDEDSSEEESE